MTKVDIATLRTQKRFAKQDYDKQLLAEGGAARADYSDCGPPTWNRQSWENFRAQYGRYPFDANERPPGVENAPLWVKELCGIHRTPAER